MTAGTSTALALAALCAAGGCGAGAPEQPAPRRAPRTRARQPLDALSRRFSRVREALRRRGYTPQEDTARDFALEGDGFVAALELDASECTTVAGLGGARLLDLRFVLYDAAGARIVADDVPGGAALVHVCPLTSGRYWLAASSSRGVGAVVYETFVSAPGRGQGFEGVFGGTLVPPPPSEALGRQLEMAAAGLLARGAEVVDGPWVETLAEGSVARRTVSLTAGDCYVVAAHAAGSDRDVDLFLFDPSGAEVARDLRPGASFVLSHCAATSGPHTVELRTFEGSGSVAVIVARVPAPAADAGAPEPRRGFDPDVAVDEELATLERRGYRRVSDRLHGVALTTGAVATHEIVLSSGCTTLLVAGGAGVGDIDLYLYGADGSTLDRDVGLDLVSRVIACVTDQTAVRLEVKMFSGAGGYVLGRAISPLAIDGIVAARLDLGGAPYRARGFVTSRPAREVTLAEGERQIIDLEQAAGECAAFVAAGDTGLLDVDLVVRDADGRVLASDTGTRAWAAVSVCTSAHTSLRVEVRAYRGSGTTAVELLTATAGSLAPPASRGPEPSDAGPGSPGDGGAG